MSIPKIIHYCWFGRNPKPELAIKCIKSWKKYCPEYEIIEWNEDNFAISDCPLYVRQAYELGKWAFVTDYVRLKVVYENGGIYLDTDVELKKSLNGLLSYEAYFGFENSKEVNTGLGFGAVQGAEILEELMADYAEIPFILPDGSPDRTPCPARNTQVFLRWGLKQDNSKQILRNSVLILPTSFLCPLDCETHIMKRSRDTLSIHWYSAAWLTEAEKKKRNEKYKTIRRWMVKDAIIHAPNRVLRRVLGSSIYENIKSVLKGN